MPPATIEAAAAESELIRKALQTAHGAHGGQVRSGSGGMAYIHHPVAVAELLAAHGFGEETVAAALLHDVVEDSEVGIDELAESFGDRVASLVAALTDDETVEPYERRKSEHRDRVAATGGDALAIYAADKLSNIRVLRRAYAKDPSAGNEFKVPLEAKEVIWRDDLEMLRREAPELPFLADLEAELGRLAEAHG